MRVRVFLARVLGLLLFLSPAVPAAGDMEGLLPPVSCGTGWKIEGKAVLYDRDTLSDRIDGEAELYFPYGFDRMAASRYGSDKEPGAGIDVEIFRMGSLLDAFGMYANYRQKEGRSVGVGAESSLSPPQLYFYQGRHFVHIQITGANDPDPEALATCARAVALRLPGPTDKPAEISVFARPEVVKGTERYLPESLLGYDFLNKGLIADVSVERASFQIFLLLHSTAESASGAFERFLAQLEQAKVGRGAQQAVFIEGKDPLYGPVMVLKKGNCLAGALKFSENKAARVLLENICR